MSEWERVRMAVARSVRCVWGAWGGFSAATAVGLITEGPSATLGAREWAFVGAMAALGAVVAAVTS